MRVCVVCVALLFPVRVSQTLTAPLSPAAVVCVAFLLGCCVAFLLKLAELATPVERPRLRCNERTLPPHAVVVAWHAPERIRIAGVLRDLHIRYRTVTVLLFCSDAVLLSCSNSPSWPSRSRCLVSVVHTLPVLRESRNALPRAPPPPLTPTAITAVSGGHAHSKIAAKHPQRRARAQRRRPPAAAAAGTCTRTKAILYVYTTGLLAVEANYPQQQLQQARGRRPSCTCTPQPACPSTSKTARHRRTPSGSR